MFFSTSSWACTEPTTPISNKASNARTISRDSRAMRVVPVKLPRLTVERTGLERARADPGDGQHLGGIAGGEDLIGVLEVGIAHHSLGHRDAGVAQEADDALSRDAGEERAVR